jgi:hypothetical protein
MPSKKEIVSIELLNILINVLAYLVFLAVLLGSIKITTLFLPTAYAVATVLLATALFIVAFKDMLFEKETIHEQ